MKKPLSTLAAIAALALAGSALADNHETDGNLADGWYIHVKQGMAADFEKAFAEHIKFRQSKDDPRSWQVYTPVLGDKLGYYAVRACCMKYEDMDSYRAWAQEAGVGEHWNDNVDQYVAKYQHYLNEFDFANSNWPEDPSSMTLFGVTHFYRKPGKAADLEMAKVRMSELAKEHGWPYHWSWADRVGGKDILMLVIPHENFADMAPPEQNFVAFLTEKLGSADEAQALMAKFTGAHAGTTHTVYRHREDLSMPEAE